MWSIIIEFVNNMLRIYSILVGVLIGAWVTLYVFRLKATRHFRQVIFSELKGIYPEPRITAEQANTQIRRSIKEIESASTEFRHFVSFYRKGSFDRSVQKYCKMANDINWSKHTTKDWFPSMQHLSQIQDPKPEYFNCIEELLKFAK